MLAIQNRKSEINKKIKVSYSNENKRGIKNVEIHITIMIEIIEITEALNGCFK